LWRRFFPIVLVVVVDVVVVVWLPEFVFCAKTRLPKLRTKMRVRTIPILFLTYRISFECAPLTGRSCVMIEKPLVVPARLEVARQLVARSAIKLMLALSGRATIVPIRRQWNARNLRHLLMFASVGGVPCCGDCAA
jgi:hypothetical protein